MRYVRSVMGSRHAGLARLRARSAGRVRALRRASPGTAAGHLRGLPRPRRHRPRARPRRHRRRPPARRSRCACCGASMAPWAAASTCSALWRERADDVTGRHACPAATTSPRRRRAELLAEALHFFNDRRTETMSTQRIAVIAGDGIGKEVMPEGRARARGRGAQVRHRPALRPLRFLQLGLLREARQDAAGRLEGPDRRPRRDLLRRGRLAREDRRPRLAVGLAAAVPPRVRPVRQPAAGAPDARHHRARGAPRRQRRAQPGEIDMYIVRENTEGEYSSIGGRMYAGHRRARS